MKTSHIVIILCILNALTIYNITSPSTTTSVAVIGISVLITGAAIAGHKNRKKS